MTDWVTVWREKMTRPKYQIYLGGFGKLSGHRLAYSIRLIARGKNKGKSVIILHHGKKTKRIITAEFKYLGEL